VSDDQIEVIEEPGFDRVERVDLQLEMQRSYLDYAMSVIVGRALPDVRDGLKPVHRRILYAMYDGGYRPNAAFSKSSRVVGDVMGSFHPHGDAAIYDALARLVQPWSMRYPLVAGQGNFGTPGNLGPAARPGTPRTKRPPPPRGAARGVADPDISDTEAWADYENSLLDVQATSKALLETMGQLRQRELERAVNLVGAHRDDLTLFLGHLPAKGFASHGEQWSLALALRLASFELMRADSALTSIDGKSEDPILILDDVFAELDMRRRRALSQMVAQAQQVLITAAVGDDVPSELDHHRLRVAGSVVSEV